MTHIDSTPQMARGVYERIASNLQTARRINPRPLTLADKVLLGHLADVSTSGPTSGIRPGETYVQLRPDRVVFQDVLGQTGMLQFMQTRRERVAVPTTIHCDHLIQARVGGTSDLRESLAENSEVYDFLRSAAAKYGVGFWEPGAGIIHQVVFEHYAFPGELIIGTDSHTPNAGGLGACAVGVGGADAVEVIAGLPWELLYPRRIAVYLTGRMSGWTAPKDVILYVAGKLTVSGGTNAIIEYIGPGARTISATGKATITNMGAELGATTSMFPADEHMMGYLRATRREGLADLAEQYRDLLEPDAAAEANPHEHYDQVLELDLSTLEPHVVGPHSPDRARPISRLAAEVWANDDFCDEISSALIGSCTNSSYEDMSRAADVAEQAASHGVRAKTPFMVTPGSDQIRATIQRDGQMHSLESIGGSVLANACGPCIGQWRRDRVANKPNTIVTSYNRNFPARNDGFAKTMNFIASPEIVTALAIAGRLSFNPLTDVLVGEDGQQFRLAPPQRAPEVPTAGFDPGRSAFVAPPASGAEIQVRIDPKSERLQVMQPWPAWNREDFLAMPILMKTRGKTTTDHISPAGPWLKLRGHLDRFSENLLMGATNAYTGEAGKGRNVLSGETSQPIAKIARDYQARGVRWLIVGDSNYGEGSSREHAALSPRLLGGAVVIARSFARIHETNLKKQGLLALTFADPADYERIGELDRVDVMNLDKLAPNQPVGCRIHHSDGSSEVISLRHSYGASQLEWFRAGSALNGLVENPHRGFAYGVSGR